MALQEEHQSMTLLALQGAYIYGGRRRSRPSPDRAARGAAHCETKSEDLAQSRRTHAAGNTHRDHAPLHTLAFRLAALPFQQQVTRDPNAAIAINM